MTIAPHPFTGCGTALVTPFRPDRSLDEAALRVLVRRQIDAGMHFLVPCGTTGESPTLNRREHVRVVEIAVEEAQGRVPVVAGAGGYHTDEVIELARACHAAGANGLLSVTPYYNKPTQEGLYQHYEAIAHAVPLPILVYNVPGRTGANVEPITLRRLAGIENIVGVKESSGNLFQVANLLQQVPETFTVLAGDDALAIPIMALGGRGVISVVGNQIPGPMSQLAAACLEGDFGSARRIQRQYLTLMEANFLESNPIPVKAVMALMGLLEPVWRLPLVAPSAATQARLEALAQELGLAVQQGVPVGR